jgi:hypothetical protein
MDDWAKALAGCIDAETQTFGEEVLLRHKKFRASVGSTDQTEALEVAGYVDHETLQIVLPATDLIPIDDPPDINEIIELRNKGYRIEGVKVLEAGHGYELRCQLIPEYKPSQKPSEPIYFTPDIVDELQAGIIPNKPTEVASLAKPLAPNEIDSDISPLAPDEVQAGATPATPDQVKGIAKPVAPDQVQAEINYVDMYIVAGQSNAHGHSETADLTGTQVDDISIGFYTSWHNNTSNATTTQYYSDYVTSMELGKTRGDSNESTLDSDYFGVEWGFAKRLEYSNTNNKEIGIMKYAVGASTIDDNATLTDWDLQKTTEAWQGLKNAIADSITELASQGKTPVWKGFLWYQGESNGGTEPYIYKQALNDLCQALETELGVTDLPAVFVAPANANGNDLYVNNAHVSLAREEDFYSYVKASDYHDGANANVHLSAQNMYDLGEAVGIAMELSVAGTSLETEFQPSANLDFWLDGDDASLVTENSSTHEITSVQAKAGNIDILPRSKDANAPTIIHEHNAIANRDCFTMSHDREYLETDGLVNMPTSTHDWFVVARPNGINNGQDAIWATEAGRSVTLIPLGPQTYTWFWNNTPVSSAQGTSSLDGELSLFCIRWNFNGQHTSTWFNGTQIDSQRSIGSASNFSMVDLRFHFMAQYGATNATDGNFCEAIVSRATADRLKIEGYLAHKWGIANKLPASHTYKYYAP